MASVSPRGLLAQSNTRLLLSSGWGVPEHAGFVFGPFSDLTMNAGKEIVFLTSMRGAKSELRSVVRSDGITFSVVAFEGLVSPVPKAVYESFSAPSVNDAGVIAFSAALKDAKPASGVIHVVGSTASAIAVSGESVPGIPGATFQEFSAPLINSAGNVLFSALTAGKQPGIGMFLWTPQGTQNVPLPPELRLASGDLLEPFFFSHDEAVWIPRNASRPAAVEQLFRVTAARNFQELNPPPAPNDAVEILPARAGEAPVKLLLVVMEGAKLQLATLDGDPSQPVMAKRPPGVEFKPLNQVQAQTTGAGGGIIFVSAPFAESGDLGLYCYCQGQIIRLTSPEEFLPITEAAKGRPILSLGGDSQHTIAFIAPLGEAGEPGAIYVTSVP